MTQSVLRLFWLPAELAVCQLPAGEWIPSWAAESEFWCVARTPDELSIVCEQRAVPSNVRCEPGWRAFGVAGPLDFSLTGILARLAQPLAQAGVSIFAVSTYDTDYVLVRSVDAERAAACLAQAGMVWVEQKQ